MTASAIIIDSREATWCQELKFGGLPVSVAVLSCSDAMIACDDGNLVLIERKTIDDLLGSIRDGRLLDQVARMQDQTRWVYLVITGLLAANHDNWVVTDRGVTGWNLSSVEGALLSVQELGAFVYFCKDETDYEACVLRIASREHKPELILPPAKFPRILSAGEQIIASLPGIGLERLSLLLEQLDSPAWILSCLTDTASEFKGIPSNVKTKVRAALKLKDADQLTVVTNEQGAEVLSILPMGSQ